MLERVCIVRAMSMLIFKTKQIPIHRERGWVTLVVGNLTNTGQPPEKMSRIIIKLLGFWLNGKRPCEELYSTSLIWSLLLFLYSGLRLLVNTSAVIINMAKYS